VWIQPAKIPGRKVLMLKKNSWKKCWIRFSRMVAVAFYKYLKKFKKIIFFFALN
jgi:hypothetical protein